MVKSSRNNNCNNNGRYKVEERGGNFDRHRNRNILDHQQHRRHHHHASHSTAGSGAAHNKNRSKNRSSSKSDEIYENPLDLPQNVSPSILDFFHRIGQRLHNRHRSGDLPFDTNNNDDVILWRQSWAAAAIGAGDSQQLSFLTQALLHLPDSTSISPPCEEIIAVLQRIVVFTLDDIVKISSSRSGSQSTVQTAINNLECITDIIRDRLVSKMNITLDPKTTIENVERLQTKFRDAVVTLLNSSHGDAIDDRLSILLSKAKDIKNLSRNLQTLARRTYGGSDSALLTSSAATLWNGWTKPTVGWLMSANWQRVEGLKAVYKDPAEYAETLSKIWTLLTFYWGAGALWVKCRCMQPGTDSPCGEPLLVAIEGGRCTFKRGDRTCGAPAAFKCHRRSHDEICERCLIGRQELIVGPTGPFSSTDIYDALVDRETTRRDGVVFVMSQLQSRKPPKIAPNWSTTYRLQPSALVAVVKLGVSRERLSRDRTLQWAEVVLIDPKDSRAEKLHRESGRIALRILTRGDIPALSAEVESPLDIKSAVAIIDLRVFVPEVVSVLSTLTSDSFATNLALLPFVDRLIGSPVSAPATQGFLFDPLDSIDVNVLQAISNSEIKFIYRLSVWRRKSLAARICNLGPVKSLYGTQLEAFCSALANSIHCTQGPPGTGKSYIGVCLVLALDLIRQEAESDGQAVGPVVILSYKNHALDEFLCDVDQYTNFRPGMLIRAGKSENQRMSRFSERFSRWEERAQEELSLRITVQRHARKAAISWRNLFLLLEDASLMQTAINDDLTLHTVIALFDAVLLYQKSLTAAPPSLTNQTDSEFAYCQIEHLHSASRKNRAEAISDEDFRAIVSNLWDNSEHWSDQLQIAYFGSRQLFLVAMWLSGKVPPPRCTGIGVLGNDRCLEHVANKGEYCRKFHSCFSKKSSGISNHSADKGCVSLRCNVDVPYCEAHRCLAGVGSGGMKQGEVCPAERILNADFCESHCCPGCIQLNAFPIQMKLAFACKNHKCAGSLPALNLDILDNNDICQQLQKFPYKYCAQHLCIICATSDASAILLNLPKVRGSQVCVQHKCRCTGCGSPRDLTIQSEYCKIHSCKVCIKLRLPPRPLARGSKFCEEHRCKHPHRFCAECKLGETRSFCRKHSCKVCFGGPCIEDPPRNTCDNHRLCFQIMADGDLCGNFAAELSQYCLDHTLQFNSSKGPSQRRLSSATPLSSSSSSSTSSSLTQADSRRNEITSKQCNGLTKTTSERCRSLGVVVLGGLHWCKLHKGQFCPSIPSPQDSSRQQSKGPDNEDQQEFKRLKQGCSVQNSSKKRGSDVSIFRLEDDSMKRRSKDSGESSDLAAVAEDLDIRSHSVQSSVEAAPIVMGIDSPEVVSDVKGTVASIQSLTTPELLTPDTLRDLNAAKLNVEESIIVSDAMDILGDDEEYMRQQGNDLDAAAVDIHPDELEMDFYAELEGEDEQLNEDAQRLREIIDNDNSDEEASLDGEILVHSDERSPDTSPKLDDASFVEPAEWSWDYHLEERYRVASIFLRRMHTSLVEHRKNSEQHINAARTLRAEAGAQAFRSARIVGATVVCASRRLEAIRAACPFAIVVEEACEVMEPTLMSVLAVHSVQKLELVGDHRQLPAFVQNCWFSFESTLPSIKTSLFERLISGSVTQYGGAKRRIFNGSHQVDAEPICSSILDEQRRMRPAIADITRSEYEDVVSIVDHPNTSTQRIGDVAMFSAKVIRDNLYSHRSLLCHGCELSVPGMGTAMFFWNIQDNHDSKAKVGLSACNPTEAAAVVSLTKWLILCGIPKASISIITPYKGQKMEILSLLRKEKINPPFQPHGADKVSSTSYERPVIVSTVDRYQGDENDVVILSLVRTKPGNRFVALQNRFIVATSRARIGFYVIGALEAVVHANGPPHWRRFVSSLESKPSIETSASNDSEDERSQSLVVSLPNQSEQSNEEFSGPRIGRSLPICCPRHGSLSTRIISSGVQFPSSSKWASFCRLSCPFRIPICNHSCGKACHCPILDAHTAQKQCKALVARPCEEHENVSLLCCDLKFGKKDNLEAALLKFKCQVQVSYQRPECEHSVSLPCFKAKDVQQSRSSLPDCVEPVPDYCHPSCNHIIERPQCCDRRRYEQNTPICLVQVRHVARCGCVSEMPCSESVREGLQPSICMQSKNFSRPRCHHRLSLRCHLGEAIQAQWDEHRGECISKGERGESLVIFGSAYGPVESFPQWTEQILPPCAVAVNYKASCGHIVPQKVRCFHAFDLAAGHIAEPQCLAMVELRSPICGHIVKCPCWLAQLVRDWKPWEGEQIPEVFSESMLYTAHQRIKDCHAFLATAEKYIQSLCTRSIKISRACNQDHFNMVHCKDMYYLLLGRAKLRPCSEPVKRFLQCTHSTTVPCSRLGENPPPNCLKRINECFAYPCGIDSIKGENCCKLTRLKSIANPECPFVVTSKRYRCGHSIQVKCHLRESVEGKVPGEHILSIDTDCAESRSSGCEQAIVVAGTAYCADSLTLPPCADLVSYRYPCGHMRPNIPCSLAFAWAAGNAAVPRCDQFVSLLSPLCGHRIQVPCWSSSDIEAWHPWGEAGKPKSGEISVSNELGDLRIQSIVWSSDRVVDTPLPVSIPIEFLFCDSVGVSFVRSCGHSRTETCAPALLRLCGPCVETVAVRCPNPECGAERTLLCHELQQEALSGHKYVCRNIISKRCNLCAINKCASECFRGEVACKRDVRGNLACGHQVVWRCGFDQDPRLLSPLETCHACILPQWQDSLNNIETEDEIWSFAKSARNVIVKAIEEIAEVGTCNEIGPTQLNNALDLHCLSRKRVCKEYMDFLQHDPKSKPMLPPASLDKPQAFRNYDIVFRAVSGDNVSNAIDEFRKCTNTAFGNGFSFLSLTANNLKALNPASDGTVRICVGLAFRLQTLSDVPPFSLPRRSRFEQPDVIGTKQANRAVVMQRQKGFDSVNFSCVANDSTASSGVINGMPITTRICWEPSSAIPFADIILKLHVQCMLCFDQFTESQGFFCNQRHFICWNECFDKYVRAASVPGAVGRSVDRDGNLKCPECNDTYDLHTVANCGGPKHVFDALFNLRSNALTARAVEEELHEQEKRLKEEFERIQKIQNLDLRIAESLRIKIVDSVLNLRCPRCEAVFNEFDGCFALTCHRNSCRAGFCAWCLADCGGDAHAHVARCGTMHGSFETFTAHHREKRRIKVLELIEVETQEVQIHLRRVLQKDLEDLGIVL